MYCYSKYDHVIDRAETSKYDTTEKVQFLLDTLQAQFKTAKLKKQHSQMTLAFTFSDGVKALLQAGLVKKPQKK